MNKPVYQCAVFWLNKTATVSHSASKQFLSAVVAYYDKNESDSEINYVNSEMNWAIIINFCTFNFAAENKRENKSWSCWVTISYK